MRTRVVIAAAWLLAGFSSAEAASVTVLKGEALASRGDGYETLKGSANFGAGDVIVPKIGSSVKVTFSNGCTVFLGAGMVFSVPINSPCGGPSTAASSSGGLQETDTALIQDWSAATQTTAFDATQPNLLPYLLGAVAIGGVSAAAVGLSGGGNPTSP
ncbi:hypothetical protein [Hyphomicrobium sp. 99]|uniref:hypothetical protein n=1 Tax=Hyphomicrobium sp. 99 TaxID=1163419 RepID=UPI0005F81527|nr:hypothetical protein [Hyphomicrobium sp. 99]